MRRFSSLIALLPSFAVAELREEIASDLAELHQAALGHEVQCRIVPMSTSLVGTYTAGFHEDAWSLKRTLDHTTKSGLRHRMSDVWLETRGKVYYANFPDDYPKVIGVGSIHARRDLFSALEAFRLNGYGYDQLVRMGNPGIERERSVTILGYLESNRYSVQVWKLDGKWRVASVFLQDGDLMYNVSISGWSEGGCDVLPRRVSVRLESRGPYGLGAPPNKPTDIEVFGETFRPSKPLSLSDIYRPQTTVVEGNSLWQMSNGGKLVDANGTSHSVDPYGLTRLVGSVGLAFFSGLWFVWVRYVRSAKRTDIAG